MLTLLVGFFFFAIFFIAVAVGLTLFLVWLGGKKIRKPLTN